MYISIHMILLLLLLNVLTLHLGAGHARKPSAPPPRPLGGAERRRGGRVRGQALGDSPAAGADLLPAAALRSLPPTSEGVPVEEEDGDPLLQYPFPEELSDGSTLVVTVDGRLSRMSPGGEKLWTADVGGPMVTSFQNGERERDRPYAIIPQLDGRGVVHLQGKGALKKTVTKIPMTVKAFADLVPQYSHTPDGINYRKDESQLLVYVDWETGAADVMGCRDSSDRRCRREMASKGGGARGRAQLFLTRVTTIIYATDVYTREPIFNFSYSELRPVSMLYAHKVTGPRGGPLLPAGGVRLNDTLHSFSDGSVVGLAGRARMDTLVFDAFRVSQSMSKLPLSSSASNALGGAADDLIVSAPRYPYDPTVFFRKIPVKQHFGNSATSAGEGRMVDSPAVEGPAPASGYYAYASFDSGVCDAAVSRVLASDTEDTGGVPAPAGELISVVNGGAEFGLFAVTYDNGEAQTAPWVRGLLPRPADGYAEGPAAGERDVCFPADSADGNYYISYFDAMQQSPDRASGSTVWDSGVEGAQCLASSSYFVHEVVSPAGHMNMLGADTATIDPTVGSSVVDLDMLFDNLRHSAGVFEESTDTKLHLDRVALPPTGNFNRTDESLMWPVSPVPLLLTALLSILMLGVVGLRWPRRESVSAAVIVPHPRQALMIDTSAPPGGSVTNPSRVARVVGNIHITENLLGVGSSGTLVYYGYTSELGVLRPVAIKQMLRSNYSHAIKEIANLKKIDAHDNVVNYYMCEQNENFVFLALQLCRMNLKDFVARLERCLPLGVLRLRFSPAHSDGVRAALLQAAEAIEYLHRKGVLHRDIKPHNILMEELQGTPLTNSGCSMFAGGDIEIYDIADVARFKLRVSDFGLSKNVKTEDMSFGSQTLEGGRSTHSVVYPEDDRQPDNTSAAIGQDKQPSKPPGSARHWDAVGTIGWQAPELIKRRLLKRVGHVCDVEDKGTPGDQSRLTSKVDVFALGCVYHFTLVPGSHPFGHWREREDNIINNVSDLSLLARTPDAYDLVHGMIRSDPKLRPTARQVCFHPFFWNSQKRLEFWEALYCRLKKESGKSRLMRELEVYADPVVCCKGGNTGGAKRNCRATGWGATLDVAFQREIDNPPHGIIYEVTSIYSCLRFIRHKKSHFDELDGRLKNLLSLPQGYMRYFESQLPRLFLYTVWFAATHLPGDKEFQRFNLGELAKGPFFSVSSPPLVTIAGRVDDPVPRTEHASTLDGALEVRYADCTPPIEERSVPLAVRRTFCEADNISSQLSGARKHRGYYGWPAQSSFLLSIPSSDKISAPYPGGNSVSESVQPESEVGKWARGVPLAPANSGPSRLHPSAVEASRREEPILPLVYTNVYIPPLDNASRPLHIRKSLENERYRTELCREWEESGKFFNNSEGRNCIGDVDTAPTIRTKQCCKFRRGQRQCDYAHGRLELRARGMQRLSTGPSAGRYMGGDLVDGWGHS